MALITKEHLSLTLQTLKKLLSFKADKTEVNNKIDKDKIATDDDILDLLLEIEFIIPASNNNNSIFINEKGEIYIL